GTVTLGFNGFTATKPLTFSAGTNEVQRITLGGTGNGTFQPAYNGLPSSLPLTVSDEVQTITLGGATGGTFTLSFSGSSASVVRNGTTTTGSNTITGLSTTTDLTVGTLVSGAGIPANTTITSISSTS